MTDALTDLEKKILEGIQLDFPLCSDPYAEIAKASGCTREEAHKTATTLRKSGVIRRIGGSFVPAKLGYVSALAAACVDSDRLEEVAARASSFPEVTHNYEREGKYNLWFTIIAPGKERLEDISGQVRRMEGVLSLHVLPSKQTFKLRVHFSMNQEDRNARQN